MVAGPLGGALADRYNRRLVIITATLTSAIQASVLALLVLNGMVQTWHLYVFVVLEALFNGINGPARMAFVYDVSSRENATNAYSLNAIVQNLSRILGPNLAGVVIGLFGVGYCFIVLSAMKVASTLFTVMIAASAGGRPRVRKNESYFTTLIQGIKYALSDRVILALLLLNTVKPLLILPYIGFLPVFAKDVFYGSGDAGWHTGIGFLDAIAGRGWAAGYGLIASGLAFGSIPGALLIAYLGNFRGRGLALIIGLMGYDIMILLFSRQSFLWFGWVCLIGAGVANIVFMTLFQTLLQLWSRDDMRGRVMAFQSMEQGLQPLGSLPMGIAIDRIGAPNTVTLFTATAAVIAATIALLSPQIRREPPTVHEEAVERLPAR